MILSVEEIYKDDADVMFIKWTFPTTSRYPK